MVQNFPNKYQNKLISTEHCLSDIYQNIDLQKKFISNLQRDIKSKIKIRLELLSRKVSKWHTAV